MARKFLYVIAALVLLFVLGGILLAVFRDDVMYIAMTPGEPFTADQQPPEPDYAQASAWAARPGTEDAADQVPDAPGVSNRQADAAVDVFYVAPTTYYNNKAWNAPIDDPESRKRVDDFVLKYQASAFNGTARVYAPLYRQATLAAFFADNREDGEKALALAYGDVIRAFDHYMAHDNQGRPFLLAAHSQGSRHLIRLLEERIDGTALAHRMVAAYAVGYPLPMDMFKRSFKTLEPCREPAQTRCVLTWNSFDAQDGDVSVLRDILGFSYDGVYEANKGKKLLCVNPLNWTLGGEAPAASNLGALSLSEGPMGTPDAELTGARCDDGALLVALRKEDGYSGFVMPGGNYHVYDYNLFYMNIRENAARRVERFLKEQAQDGTPLAGI
jgi:hypothetical protein